MMKMVLMVVILFFFYKNQQRTERDRPMIFVFITATLIYLLVRMMHGANINGLIVSIPLFFLYMLWTSTSEFSFKTYDYFVTVYSIIIALAIVSWGLYSTGHGISMGHIQHPSQDRSYAVFPFLLVEDSVVNMMRFNGPFDEAGVVGTIGALLLCINGYQLKDWRNIVIFISGLLSLSLFFYILTGVFIILQSVLVKRRVWLALVIVGAFAGFYFLTQDNEVLSQYMWRRLSLDEEGQLVGDTRMSESADFYYEKVKGSSEFFFGVRNRDEIVNNLEGSSSYKVVILYNGIVFFLLYCLSFVILGHKNRKDRTSFFLFLLVFALTSYQRTNIYVELFMFLYAMLAKTGFRKPQIAN